MEDPNSLNSLERKYYDHIDVNKEESKVTHKVVSRFNHELFLLKCKQDLPQFDADLTDLDILSSEVFQRDEIWITRDALATAIKTVAGTQGWCPRLNGNHIQCNRYGASKTKRDYSRPLQNGCTWRLTMKALVKTKYLGGSSKQKETEQGMEKIRRKNWQYKSDWANPVKMTEINSNHAGECQPGKMTRVDVMSRAGAYSREIPERVLFTLCNFYKKGGRLRSAVIRRSVEPILPKNKVLSSSDTFNIRVKIIRLMPIYRLCNGAYEQFSEQLSESNLTGFVDDETDLDDDVAYQIAHDLWLEISTDANKEDGIFTFVQYLNLIKSRAKGFSFKIASGEGSRPGKKRLLGVLWMTATMRRNYELFGRYISMDMMKRGINKLLWPYSAVTMYDESKHLCLACEGIMCGERGDMYEFTARFLEEFAPGRPLSEVSVVSGDGFFNQKLIHDMGFVNALLISDQWHLLDSGLELMFGKSVYGLIGPHLVRMVRSTSALEYEETLESARSLLASCPVRSGEAEETLTEFANQRATYATYMIAEIPGNRGLHGSAMAEQNHSSVLCHLNDGDKTANHYRGQPDELIRDLLNFQSRHVKQTNQRLYEHQMKLRIELTSLKNEPDVHRVRDLISACETLNLPSYERYKSRSKRAHDEYERLVEGSSVRIQSKSHPDAPPRVFATAGQRCLCPERLEHEDMCCHEILAHGGFKSSMFMACHLARKVASGSVQGIEVGMESSLDDLLGYELEPLSSFEENDGGKVGSPDEWDLSQDIDESNFPPGYLPPTSQRVTPLDKHLIGNILTTVSGA
ncbi:hypothetical protein ACHAWF_005077 [Thalassiosira exigua]